LLCILIPCVVHARNVGRNVDTREVEESAAKSSILMYDEDVVNQVYQDATKLMEKIKDKCKCQIEHLPGVQSFILHYEDSAHLPASTFSDMLGIVYAGEDEIVLPPDDEDNGEADEDRMLSEADRQSATTNDKLSYSQWAYQDLRNDADINWKQGHDKYLADARNGGHSNVVVAVIDSGVDYNHPDLKKEMWRNPNERLDGIDNDGNGIVDDIYGANFAVGEGARGDPMDKNSHGTHCAGIIAASANNGRGIAGVAGSSNGKVKIMAVKAMKANGSGQTSWLLDALNYAVSMGAQISSNSYGGRNWAGIQQTERILKKHSKHLFISAAGNDNKEVQGDFTPCAVQTSNSICVASSTKDDSKSGFSNYDSQYVHVFAPGSSIMSTVPGGKYGSKSGTSMACPMVSGLAALMMSMRGQVSPAEVKDLIELNVQKKWKYYSYVSTGGLIDVDKTISSLIDATASKPVCKNQEPDRYCKRYKWACNLGIYTWLDGSCKKTCNNC